MTNSSVFANKRFKEMLDSEFETAVRTIVTTSSSVTEVCAQLDEIGYPYANTIISIGPVVSEEDNKVLGFLRLMNGLAINAILNSPSGAILRLN